MPLAAYSTGVDPATEPELDPPATKTNIGSPDAGAAAAHPAAPALPMFVRAAPDDLPADPFGQAAAPRDSSAGPRPAFRDILRDPRANIRDPRLLLSGVIALGVVLLAVSLLGGGAAKGQGTALASPSAPAGPLVSAGPGNASVEITGALTGTFELTGVTGAGVPSGSSMASSWGDPGGDALAIGGPVSAGTRTTDTSLTLTWTVLVKGKAVTFTSSAGECVIGMAVKPTSVSGSFTCHKVKSADGKLTVGASGTYRT